jgi:hypothetical protein
MHPTSPVPAAPRGGGGGGAGGVVESIWGCPKTGGAVGPGGGGGGRAGRLISSHWCRRTDVRSSGQV